MNIYLDTIGCRLNQAEIEQMARQFRAEGHTIIAEAAGADLVVINTCAVTTEAAADSRQKIRQAARAGAGRSSPPAAGRHWHPNKPWHCQPCGASSPTRIKINW